MASATTKKMKILRVGIIQGGKIVEERLLRKRESVTIGQAPKNTFIIPVPRLSKSYTVFEVKAGRYSLIYDQSMQGRVSVGGSVVDLAGLARSGKVHKRGGAFVLELSDESRGKVVIGEFTLLFQFVDAPPVLPKPQLPAAAKGGFAQRIDWGFAYLLLISFIIQGGGGIGLDIWWRQTGRYEQQQYRERGRRMYEVLKAEVRKQDEPDEPEEVDEPSESEDLPADDAPAEAPEPEKKPEKKKGDGKKVKGPIDRTSARYKRAVSRVKKHTIIHALLSQGDGEGDAIDTLKDAVAGKKLDSAFNLEGGVAFAKPGERSEFQGQPTAVKETGKSRYKTLGSKDGTKRIATKAVKTTTKEKRGGERKVRLSIRGTGLSGMTGTGNIDKASVARVFSRRKGAVKYCYERALKLNPNVKGKVSIRFTIGAAGRVTSIKVTANTTKDSSIGTCISGKVKSWKFPPASGGAVTFSHTFILATS